VLAVSADRSALRRTGEKAWRGSAAASLVIYPQNLQTIGRDRVNAGEVVRFTCQDLAISQDPAQLSPP